MRSKPSSHESLPTIGGGRLSRRAIQAVGPDGEVDIDALAEILRVTRADVVASIGLSDLDRTRTPQQLSGIAQRRVSALARILERTKPWTGHPRIAFAWYRSQPLPSFGGLTAEDLLISDRGSAVEDYLERIATGGYS